MSDRPGRPGPKYRFIAGDLRAQIAAGELAVGERLPTKEQLIVLYKVALNTVDRALEELRREGLIKSEQGAGTFVIRKPAEPGPSAEFVAVMSRLDEMDSQIRQLRAQVERLESE